MTDRPDSFNAAFGFFAVLAGAVLAAAVVVLFATVPIWGWLALATFLLLTGTALLSFTDPASRAFLAGTLRKSTYTQIYTTLTRRLVMRVWAALCDPVEDRASVLNLFHGALTWRLYDKALLIAVAYPILLPVGQWVVTGDAARIGSFEFLPAAPFWWDRAATMSALLVLLFGFLGRRQAMDGRGRFWELVANWLPLIAYMIVAVLAVTLSDVFNLALLASVAFAAACLIASPLSNSGIFGFSVASGLTLAWLFVFESDATFMLGLTLAVAYALYGLAARSIDRPYAAPFTLSVLFSAAVSVSFPAFDNISEIGRSLFLFVAVLPLLNALFDTVSYAVTLTLMRRGLRSRLPLLWGLLDLVLACVLFLALGCTLVVVIHGLNTLAGVPLVDLPALFAGIHERPGDYVWLYLMLFSTILPTALHGLLSLLGVQGLWPRAWRRPVAAWVEAAPSSPLAYLRAGLALGVVWTMPLLLLGGILWALWASCGAAVLSGLGLYFDVLLWLAAIPVGTI